MNASLFFYFFAVVSFSLAKQQNKISLSRLNREKKNIYDHLIRILWWFDVNYETQRPRTHLKKKRKQITSIKTIYIRTANGND